jgi:hypothetical protein
MSLKKNSLYPSEEEISMLSINQDFIFDINLNSYKRKCDRCTGHLIVNKNALNSLLNSNESDRLEITQKFILQLECDSCSFTADILII